MNKNYWTELKRWPVEVPAVPIDHHGNVPVWLQGEWKIVSAEDLQQDVERPSL